MSTAFVRQLGAESGVQLNPLRDNSEIPATDNSDQVFGIMMRATRGRIDKPFKVDRGNVFKKLGYGEQIRLSALNEAYVHVVEALNKGAYEAIIQRLSTSGAVVKSAVASYSAGSGAALTERAVVPALSPAAAFSVAPEPTGSYLFSVKHLECHNDGIKVEFRAEEKKDAGVAVANDALTLRVRDSSDNLLYEFYGSLKSDAKDDYGNSFYLPDVVQSQTDAVEVTVGVIGANAAIAITSDAYGYDENGKQKWAKSGLLCASMKAACPTPRRTTWARAKSCNTRSSIMPTFRPAARKPRRCCLSSRNWRSIRTASC